MLEVCQTSGNEAGTNDTHPEELLAIHLQDTGDETDSILEQYPI